MRECSSRAWGWRLPPSRRAGTKPFQIEGLNAESGECLRTLRGHTGTVRALCLSPDGKAARMIITHDVDPATPDWLKPWMRSPLNMIARRTSGARLDPPIPSTSTWVAKRIREVCAARNPNVASGSQYRAPRRASADAGTLTPSAPQPHIRWPRALISGGRMASVTFDITSRTVSRISWKSMTDTFGNCATRSC